MDRKNEYTPSFQTPNQRIHLTLEDLGSASQSYGDSNPATPYTKGSSHAASGVKVISPSKMDYKKELAKLLVRSRGTPYEKTLKRFVESKLYQIDHDQHQHAAEEQLLKPVQSSEVMSLMNLSKSKYDSPPKAKPQVYSPFAKTTDAYWKERVEDMARPMERNKYKGPEDANKRISTNHLGRQRPGPKINGKSKRPQSNTQEWGEASEQPAKSQEEFQSWLKNNRDWKQNTDQKILHSKMEIVQKFASSAKPRIYAKSIKLAELAQVKESAKLFEQAQQLSIQASPSRSHAAFSTRSPSATRSMDDGDSIGAASEPGMRLGVYDRLSIRGRIVAEKRRHWTPPPVESSFSPAISERSKELAKRLRERSASPSTMKRSHSASSLQPRSSNQQQQQQQQYRDSMSVASDTTGHIRNPVYSRSPIAAAGGGAASVFSNSSVKGGGQSVASVYTYPIERIPAKVKEQLDRSRSRSKSKIEQSYKDKMQQQYLRDDVVVKPFHPTLMAKETQKIMSKVKTSFEERNLRSIENNMLRQVISSRSPSPGPGYYSYSPRLSSPPPGLKYENSIKHACSPGYRGYSFGKQRFDVKTDTAAISPGGELVIDYHVSKSSPSPNSNKNKKGVAKEFSSPV